eukprot:g801.t1
MWKAATGVRFDRLRAWLTAAQYQPIMPPWHCLPLHAQARGWRAVLAFRTPMSRSTQGASWRSGGPIGGSGGSGGGVVASVLALNTGPRHFLQVYLLGGVSAGLAHVTYTAFGGSQDVWGYSRRDVPVQGASGATMAMATTTVLMSPRLPFVIFPLPVPIPGWLLLSGLLSYEAYCLAFPQGSDTIAHSAHLGGAAMGAIYFFLFRGRM